ncbi:N-acetylmuramoyl-L-alanine amidase [Frondihabitans sp. PAMC 28766]|uniref:NAD(+)/NADH kinase n=1 Tax=Frondihabitans sp. PAMC 28766 TaxID=1795630 RepID=UPI00078E02E8|nr:NAD(+)/NADH kinase [Frondihabitans sp. PAMC 28766]AMM19598.1 N-acetylmuramoyl-L-alanine amidase [Frondihabitans sp. PAMC 28766]
MSPYVVGLIPHPTKTVMPSIDVLRSWQEKSDSRLIALRDDASRVGADVELVDEEEFVERVDVVVALGGDGTMLGAMRLVANRPVPVLGVNYGNVGFLVEIEPNELPGVLEALHDGDFSLESHHAIEVIVSSTGFEASFLAFNDLSVTRRPGQGVVTADLMVEGTPYGYFKADSVVVSTPAGSTAYNYAAGGPVVSPAVAATIVTPVAPMAGIDRSIVLGPKELLKFVIGKGTYSAALELDGRVVSDVGEGAVIKVRLREDAGIVARLDAGRHGRRGRLKLSLMDLPLREDQLLELVPPEVRARFVRQR